VAQVPVIGVGLIGCGTVGSGVVELLTTMQELYTRRTGKLIQLKRILVRDSAKAAKSLTGRFPSDQITNNPEAFFATPDMPIVIEVAGGKGVVADYVKKALTLRKHVITANKSLLAAEGSELFALARQNNVSIAFEASCGGGIPIMTALQFGLMSNSIQAVYGILNGTCNYILTEMVQKGKPYAVALKEAQEAGFAEADPTLDVSGRDAAQKLAVVASLAFGVDVTDSQVWSEGIDTLDSADIKFGSELGYTIKLLAIGERLDPPTADKPTRLSLRVHPTFVHNSLALAKVNSSFNALSVYGHATGQTLYYGRGAGRLPTASAVVSDLLNVASGWYPSAFSTMRLWCDHHEPVQTLDRAQLISRYYLRMFAKDVPGVMGRLSTILGDAGISISSILQHEIAIGQYVPLVVTTHQASQGQIRQAVTNMESSGVIDGKVTSIRILDLPQG
jgi:homoserine dehydrogenase